MAHPRCVSWGDMGLDSHYGSSPRDAQRAIFTRQLGHSVRLGKPLIVHKHEPGADTEQIHIEEVFKNHKIHIHCFTDSLVFAQSLLEHFPNPYVGSIGVITYASNQDTSTVVKPHLSRISLSITISFLQCLT